LLFGAEGIKAGLGHDHAANLQVDQRLQRTCLVLKSKSKLNLNFTWLDLRSLAEGPKSKLTKKNQTVLNPQFTPVRNKLPDNSW
jgi:hypothetical protein